MELISKRAQTLPDWNDFLVECLSLCLNDPYDETKNPEGFVNLATAVSDLCKDIIEPKLFSEEVWSCETNVLHYDDGRGTERLRKAIANLMTKFLETYEPVTADEVFCVTGVTSCMDVLSHCLADAGEAFLSPTPMYSRILTNFKQRSLVDIIPIPIIEENSTEDFPVLTMEKITKAYDSAIQAGRKVRGVLIINPNNPLGDILSPELLLDILSFCNEHSLHAVFDEIYALSVYSFTEQFHSILKFPSVPDPERTHVMYSLSKDFAVAGFRVGAIITKCEPLKRCLQHLSFFQTLPTPFMDIAAKYIEDLEWLEKYLLINKERMAEKYHYCAEFFTNIGVKVRKSSAGFYLWLDFRPIIGTTNQEEEKFFMYLVNKAHICVGPGYKFFCDQPGWFRIVFTVETSHLKEGLRRIEKAVQDYKNLEE